MLMPRYGLFCSYTDHYVVNLGLRNRQPSANSKAVDSTEYSHTHTILWETPLTHQQFDARPLRGTGNLNASSRVVIARNESWQLLA